MAAVDRLFDAPGAELTVEFQADEPLLAFDRIKHIVETITRRNEAERRQIRYTSTSTLHHLSDDILAFLQQHQFRVSTSLDGPAELHGSNRPLPGRNSHARTLNGITCPRRPRRGPLRPDDVGREEPAEAR